MKIKVNIVTDIEMEVPDQFQFLDIPDEVFSNLPLDTQLAINNLRDELSIYVSKNLSKNSEACYADSVNGNRLYDN